MLVDMGHTIAFILTLAAVTRSGSPETAAVEAAVIAHHGAGTQVTSIIASADAAIARGHVGQVTFHEGLRHMAPGWRVTCALPAEAPDATLLMSKCGFTRNTAVELAAVDSANALAARGQFGAAAASEQKAYQLAAAPEKPAEAARLQLLRDLNQQMTLGMISRSDAIVKWNEMRFSFFIP